ncbi:MAG: TerC/Alx family metal homeostasis membrane protein [Bryobacteraceae bacterium]
MTPLHFPFASYWWLYLAFAAGVVVLVMADLGIFHRKVHAIGFREAAIGTAVWAALAMLFCLGFYVFAKAQFGPAAGRQAGLEFLTGYLLEWSLSLDNMFVFIVIFGYFGVPARFQHRVLFYGILGALLFRATFIALGAVLLKYAWMVILFGAFLILTGARMLFSPERQVDLDRSRAIRLLRRLLPVSPNHAGQQFLARVNGRMLATPLLLTLACIEISDVLFAIDSVPAIFAVTREPLIVFTSNVFAILGLRSMYFLLAGAVGLFHYLSYGLALVLIFVGVKMAWWNDATGGHFPLGISLGVIAGLLAGSIALSVAFPKTQPVPSRAE